MLCDPGEVVVADFLDQIGFRALGFRNLATAERTGIDLALKVQVVSLMCCLFVFSLSSTDFRQISSLNKTFHFII